MKDDVNGQIQLCFSSKSVLIPVLLYGWEDDNIVEEEDPDDGNDISSETPAREAVMPAGNFHLRGDEEDQPEPEADVEVEGVDGGDGDASEEGDEVTQGL